MTAKWHTKTLDEACHFSNGLWKGEKFPFVNVGVIRNTNFTKEGLLDETDIAYLDVEAKKFEKRRLQFGDIILEKSGGGPKQAVGRVALFDKNEGDFSFSNFTSAIRVRDPEALDFRFLHKLLYWTYISGVTEGMQSNSTGIRNLDGNAYKALRISFPEIREQHRIVAILDEAFAGIATAKANAEKNLQNARDSLGSYLESIFAVRLAAWSDRKLETVCTEITVGYVGPMKSEYVAEGVPFLRSQNVRPFEISLENLVFIPPDFNRKIAKSRLVPGDIAIVRTGYPGTAAVIPEGLPEANCSDLVIMRPGPDVNPYFLVAFFNSAFGKRVVLGNLVGAAQKHFNVGAAKNVNLHMPPMPEQRQIVRRIDEVRAEVARLESLYTRKLAALEALKQSLLHQAFSGQL